MPIANHQAVIAFHDGKQVRGIYRREIGTFQAKKGVVKINVPDYEYSFDFTADKKRYRSIFGKESDFGKIGPSGQWMSWILDDAIEALLRFRNNAVAGEGPTSIKEERGLSRRAVEKKKRLEQQEKTVKDVMELFLADIGMSGPGIKPKKPRTIKEYRLNLERDVIPAIGDRKAKEITKQDINEILDTIVKRGTLVQYNRTLSACHRMFNWALSNSKGNVVYNPCALLKKYTETPRERVLTEKESKEITNKKPRHKEIQTLWCELMKQRDLDEARILLLCILLGSRPGEICSMQWSELDEDSWWSVHHDETKTDVDLDCYLTQTAIDIIGERQKGIFVFPLKTKNDKAIPVDRLSCFVRENEHFGLQPWQPRDLRRTFTTLAKGFNKSDFIINLAQARKDSSVIRAHYDQRQYYKELRQLFETVEKEVLRIIKLR